MDIPRRELSQIDQNSPEFKKALEIARQEVLTGSKESKDVKAAEGIKSEHNPIIPAGLGSQSLDAQKTIALDSKAALPNTQAEILNRALEILQSNKSVKDPHDLVDQLMNQ